MFSFGQRAKAIEVHRIMRRLIDVSGAKVCLHEGRSEDRALRMIPVIVAAYERGSPALGELTRGLTKDLSSQGLGVVADQPFHAEAIVVAFSISQKPVFILGQVRQARPLGGGYWQLGLHLTEVALPADHPALETILPLVEHLEPATWAGLS